jgi:glucan phosphoethanolaminetransferase (alkaline phosphatase superfamily)
MKKFFDLRFVIASFFLLIGILLLIYSMLYKTPEGFNQSVNEGCAIFFIIFSIFMFLISFDKNPKDKL